MSLVFSINQIHHKLDHTDEKSPVVIQPAGEVFKLHNPEDVKILKRLGAVRDPTEFEMQLYALANGGKVVMPDDEPDEPAVDPKVAAAAAKAAAKDAAGADLLK